MQKPTMACPFSNKACTECAVYRGRHRYLNFPKQQRNLTDEHQEHTRSVSPSLSVEFEALRESVEPRAGKQTKGQCELKIRLKVVDAERNQTRVYSLQEVEKWSWGDPQLCRLVDGRQVTSFDSLLAILGQKAEAGWEEVELYEVPRFMILAGG